MFAFSRTCLILIFYACNLLMAPGFRAPIGGARFKALHAFDSSMRMSIDNRFEAMYNSVHRTIKCPFFRRRLSDIIDFSASVLSFIAARHKSLLPPGCTGTGESKSLGLGVARVAEIIQKDWSVENGKSYYITGIVTKSVYRDDCYFDGPDPDMPGL